MRSPLTDLWPSSNLHHLALHRVILILHLQILENGDARSVPIQGYLTT